MMHLEAIVERNKKRMDAVEAPVEAAAMIGMTAIEALIGPAARKRVISDAKSGERLEAWSY